MSDTPTDDRSQRSKVQIEYSAREICPAALLLQQLLRAHRIFLVHQAPSIDDLYVRIARPKFCGLLKRFWDGFILSWDVLLHGNPAVDIFNGLKLAAGGELGIGVGEEEWGSGEREVLEGFVGRTEGLVDLVVSRFGDAPRLNSGLSNSNSSGSSFQNTSKHSQIFENHPRPSDGVVFSGIGALTRSSVRNVSSWMEWLHRSDQNAYGVRDNPSSAPRQKRRKMKTSVSAGLGIRLNEQQLASSALSSQSNDSRGKPNGAPEGPVIPPSIVAVDRTRPTSTTRSAPKVDDASMKDDQLGTDTVADGPASGADTLVKYLTLGVYGSAWGIPAGRPPVHSRVSSLRKGETSQTSKPAKISDKPKTADEPETPRGHFLIGLRGELEEAVQAEATDQETEPSTDAEYPSESESNHRVMMRTLHVERIRPKPSESNDSSPNTENEATESYHDRLRIVVYILQPFIFTFLFKLHTDALAMPSFYRSLHHQLGPLQRPLLASTSPSKVSERLWEAASPKSTAPAPSNQPICDLVYDPRRLTVHTTIPNIPEPGPAAPTNGNTPPPWTRIEALSVHSQILNTYTSTRRRPSELERTCKTSRGWWVVWMRLPYSPEEQTAGANTPKTFREAFLIRKASDYVAPAARKSSGRFGRDVSGASGSGGWGPGKLAEGIGIDARQYIEGLLSLNR